MRAVEQAGREALDELRHLLGILRPDAEADTLGPQPGIARVPPLVAQFREAGLDVSLEMVDVPSPLMARLDLSAYRIVQEALTNALRHAGRGARAEVRIDTADDQLVIDVRDDGRGRATPPGTGHGIVGMRERVQLLGGRLDVGPRPDGGFGVVARLPLEREPG
jgi:signal transduction histidine kinase